MAMQVRKQQLELDMEQQTGSKEEKEFVKAVYCHPVYLTYMQLQVPLFLVFLAVYTVSVVGNLGMIVIIRINPKFHTPMYFFLRHLSFVDFCYSSVTTPKLLEILVVDTRTISYGGCMMQFFLGCTLVITETFMLAVMAYDRFVAVL